MKWIEFKVYTTAAGTEMLTAVFSNFGIDVLNIDMGRECAEEFLLTNAKNWDFADINEISTSDEPSITAYLSDDANGRELSEELKSSIMKFSSENKEVDFGSLRITVQLIDDEDWANNWKQYYKPTPIGEKLMICPSWEEPPEHGERKLLRIDPGMAFGTGLHNTTRMCLEALETAITPDMNMIDLGCGSGILSIAGHLFGARSITAIDIDEVCTEVATENAKSNGIELSTATGDVLGDDDFYNSVCDGDGYDIVVANIVAGVLIQLAPRVPRLLKADGIFISSGIIEDRAEEVICAYRQNGLKVIEEKHSGEWVMIRAKREK